MTALINAHESEIAFMALNAEGTILATASDKVKYVIFTNIKGTLIRIFKADDGNFLHEVRRGSKNSEIYSICFNSSSTFMACTSDRGTIHVFSMVTVHKKLNTEGTEKNEMYENIYLTILPFFRKEIGNDKEKDKGKGKEKEKTEASNFKSLYYI